MTTRALPAALASLLLLGWAVSGCSSSIERSAAEADVTQAPPAVSNSASASSSAQTDVASASPATSAIGSGESSGAEASVMPSADSTSGSPTAASPAPVSVGPPSPPRTTWVTRGHVVRLQFQQGRNAAPAKYFEAKVAPRGQFPDSGRATELCDVIAADGSISDCQLNPLKRGDWDIWVRSVNAAGTSDWLQGASASISSCTAVDGMAGSCEVFDKGPGGGLVVYDAGSRQSWGRYLEGALAGWSGTSEDPESSWCLSPGDLSTEIGVGAGAANTATIIEACGQSSAAGRASAYRGGGLDDWYLPSKDELVALYNRRGELGGFVSGPLTWYWSSTDYGYKEAQGLYFENGIDAADLKFYEHRVRPVRAF